MDIEENDSGNAPSTNGTTFGGRGRGFAPAGREGFVKREPGSGRGRGDGEGKRGFKSKDGEEENGEGEGKPAPVSYIPPEPTDDENELFKSSISSGVNFIKYDDIPVKVTGENVPNGIKTFAESGLRPFLLDIINKCGYTVPTPVQKCAIPCIMQGRDVMACAQTGSGKTAAFLLPIINSLLENKESAITNGECVEPQVIIVSPTRELSQQIWTECRKFIHGSSLITRIAYGGVQVSYQINQILKGVHILVATPGRLLDFLDRGKISFASVKFFVLDEADRMLDMGFKSTIDKMMGHSTMVNKTERQSLMFSATFPEDIQRMAGEYLNNYLFITVGLVGGACKDVEQSIISIERSAKKEKLLELLKEADAKRTVLFVETKRQADYISVMLAEKGMSATSIHGDREQRQREEALRDFKSGRMSILVATAVASRGLDIQGVDHVINYDLPKEVDEYVHRIGRTGRLGNRGRATSFYDPEKDSGLAQGLVKILSGACQEVPDFLQDCASYGTGAGGGGGAFGGRDIRPNHGHDIIENIPEAELEEW